jgi:hypothetical protein
VAGPSDVSDSIISCEFLEWLSDCVPLRMCSNAHRSLPKYADIYPNPINKNYRKHCNDMNASLTTVFK